MGRSLTSALALCLCLLGAALVQAAEEEWEPLFNGKDFTGWKNPDPEKFLIEDGCLVGTQTDGRGADMFTTGEWDNFELRFTYKVQWPANSGIWYRSRYQFDILDWKRPKTYSGALYPGAKSTFGFVNLDESIENREGWNHGQVYANGDHLVHWLNGHKIGEVHDKRHAKGRIGIQVHGGGGFKNMKIIIKSIELRPLKPGETPSPPPAPETTD
ncbi:MAG: DUF1080 domain-containing protein [Candidatus Brocadiia bacterium]